MARSMDNPPLVAGDWRSSLGWVEGKSMAGTQENVNTQNSRAWVETADVRLLFHFLDAYDAFVKDLLNGLDEQPQPAAVPADSDAADLGLYDSPDQHFDTGTGGGAEQWERRARGVDAGVAAKPARRQTRTRKW